MSTPGVKKSCTDDVMDLPVSDDSECVNVVDVRMSRVKFNLSEIDTYEITPHSET